MLGDRLMKKAMAGGEQENLFCPGVVAAYAALINLLTEPGDGTSSSAQSTIHLRIRPTVTAVFRDNALIYENGVLTDRLEDLDKKMADPAKQGSWCAARITDRPHLTEEDELKKTVEICKKYNKWIICDEIHCDLIRRGVTFIPIMNVAPEYADRIVVCTAPSKTFNLAGIKDLNIVILTDFRKNGKTM